MTKIYGTSDDLIEIEDVGEVSCFGTDDHDHGVLLTCADGTVLEVKYGKGGAAIWGITVIAKGSKFDRKEDCTDEDADIYSDVVYFRGELPWVYAAAEWERVS